MPVGREGNRLSTPVDTFARQPLELHFMLLHGTYISNMWMHFFHGRRAIRRLALARELKTRVGGKPEPNFREAGTWQGPPVQDTVDGRTPG